MQKMVQIISIKSFQKFESVQRFVICTRAHMVIKQFILQNHRFFFIYTHRFYDIEQL